MLYFCRKDSNDYESKQTHPSRPVAHDEHRGTGPTPFGATQRPQGKDCQYRQTQQRRQAFYHQFLRHMVQALQPRAQRHP